MDIKAHILAKIKKQKQIKTSDIVKETGFSRTYISRILKQLRTEGKIILIGKANRASYVIAEKEAVDKAMKKIGDFFKEYERQGLREDEVFDTINKETGILEDLPDNIFNVIKWAFLEILNNAIDHSGSDKIRVFMNRKKEEVSFAVDDRGVGIFENIKKKFGLPDSISAIQELIKGKQTTDPEKHTGIGIFFTSKMVDSMFISSGDKELNFIRALDDVFVSNKKVSQKGTQVFCFINLSNDINTKELFDKYTTAGTYEFSKTRVWIKLFNINKSFISRSEARRVVVGLEKFQSIVLDFKDVETVGQGFADEIFRVWHNSYPDKKIDYVNANENVEAMIKMAK
ncbi:MAG: DUF4325 domain-containing protein [Patescibacteria group bacterium]|nr:DUF4325 domain-containing protein [Patescibacteria group bacterium]